MDFDLDQTDALLSTTRAVRKRLDFDRQVPDDVLLECLQLAVQAPTGSNRQGWRWMIIRDAEKKAALLQKQNDDLQAEVTRLRSKVRVRDSLEEDLKHARAQLNRWLLFWGWVKAHSREGALRWLERFWAKGPKRSPDGCWGGGQ